MLLSLLIVSLCACLFCVVVVVSYVLSYLVLYVLFYGIVLHHPMDRVVLYGIFS